VNIQQARLFRESFSLVIPLNCEDEEIDFLFVQADKIHKSISSMLKGEISPEDYLEAIESLVPDIDDYIDEVEDNIEDLQNTGLIIIP
jgi:hypothetical protein